MAIPLKIDELCPDGVCMRINWNRFVVGSSVFMPCIDVEKAKQEVQKMAKHRCIKLKAVVRIENGLYGVRFWRVL